MRTILSSLVFLTLLAQSVTAFAQEPVPKTEPAVIPRRSGFTFELGLGASFMNVDSPRLPVESPKLGLAPLSFGIGGFFSRDVALTFRGTGTSLFQERGGGTEQVLLGYYGPSLQVYLAERLFIGGGVGLGVLVGSSLERARPTERLGEIGLGLQGRLGWAFYASKAHQFSLITEALHARTDNASSVGAALSLGWQYF
jgi:hypothetical protein